MTRSLVETIVSDGRVLLLADAAAKATILLALAWLAARLWRRGSAAARHQVWAMALCGLIALPAVSWLAPGWRLPVLRERVRDNEPAARIPASSVVVESSNPRPSPIVVHDTVARRETPPIRVAPPRAIAAEAAVYAARPATVATVAAAPRELPSTWTWTAAGALLTIWLAGFLVVALPTILGVLGNEWRRRRVEPVTGGDWRVLLEGVRRTFAIRRPIDLRRGGGWSIPATWGVGRPVVLLPEDAESWPEPTRRMVLLHELAHVRRLDAGTQLAGRLACALFWFHPLAWHALSRLRIECEHACDDCVIEAGERPVDYARQLLDLALTIRSFRSSTALAMARPNTLEVRMKALFDTNRDHTPLNRQSSLRFAAVAAIVVIGLATAHPGPSAASAKPSLDDPAKPAAKGTGKIAGLAVTADGGKPVGGADIILMDPPPKGQDVYYGKLPLRRVMADARGAFSFDGLNPGRYRVWANFGKLTSRTQRMRGEVVILPEAGDGPKPVQLRLSPAPTVTARVKDKATGKSIPGATVYLGWSDFIDDATTGADGAALLQPLTKEKWLVEAWADNYAKSSQLLSLESGADFDAEFALEPGGDLTGIVRDPSGKPLAEVGLSTRSVGKNEQLGYVTTDKEGRFRLRHLPRNLPLTVRASKKEYLDEPVSAKVDDDAQVLKVTLRPRPHGGSIAGVVVDDKGKPIAGAELSNSGHSSGDVREAKTGPDGRFRLENLYESYRGKEVLVRAKGSAPKRMKVEPGPVDKPAEMTIAMELGHRVSGVVVDDKGHVLEGVVVYFADANHANSDGGQSKTDKQGRFTFDSLPPDCPFTFSKQGYSQIDDLKLALDGDEVARVEMIPSGVIAGKVVDAKTGKPVRTFNVRVTFSPKWRPNEPNGGLVATLSDPGQTCQSDEGLFVLGDLVATMPLQVMIAAEGYERHVAERIVAARSDAPGSEVFSLDPIDPATLRTYSGRLLDDKGKPIVGANVRLIAARDRNEQPRGAYPFNWQMITSGQIGQAAGVTRFLEGATDKQGKFAFAKIPKDDSVEIVWWIKGFPAGRADNLHLREDNEKQAIEITVPAPGRITGTVDRKAFGDVARVAVSPANGAINFDELKLKPDQKDFEIGDLPAGEYHIILRGPWVRDPGPGNALNSRTLATGKVTVDAGGTSRIEFR